MIKIAPSVMCVDFLNFKHEIEELHRSGSDYFHIDIMDGHFVPNFSLNLQTIKDIKKISNVPIDVHLMIENPEVYLEQFLELGVEVLSFHIETVKHPNRLIKKIRSYNNTKSCIAVNPATSIEFLPYVIDNLDMLLIMTVDPGFAGQKFNPSVVQKIESIRKYANNVGKDILIEVDGNIGYETSPMVIDAGANILVAGTSSVFKRKNGLTRDYEEYKNFINTYGLKNIV